MYETAKAVVVERPGRAAIQEIRLPEIDDETVVVKTHYSGISTGTEMKVYLGLSGALGGALWYPLIPGYEEVGEVVHVGKNARPTPSGEQLKVGDRVMANEIYSYPDHCAAWGGQVEFAVNKPGTTPHPCTKIPDGVSYQEAVVAYLASVAKKGVDKVGVQPGETVLVIGMGTVGLSAVQLARIAGAGKVFAMDISKPRLDLAKRYADEVIDPSAAAPVEQIQELTDGRLVDVVIECSGRATVVRDCIDYLRDGGWDREDDGGRIHLQADYPPSEAVMLYPYQKWFVKNLRLSMTCAFLPGGKEEVLDLIAQGRFDAKGLYTKEVPVAELPAAYEELRRSKGEILKILAKW